MEILERRSAHSKSLQCRLCFGFAKKMRKLKLAVFARTGVALAVTFLLSDSYLFYPQQIPYPRTTGIKTTWTYV